MQLLQQFMVGLWLFRKKTHFVITRRLLDKSQGNSSFCVLEQTPPVPFIE
jgi:hypothetical protein